MSYMIDYAISSGYACLYVACIPNSYFELNGAPNDIKLNSVRFLLC